MLNRQDDFERKPSYFGYYFKEKNHHYNNIFIGVDTIDNDHDLNFVFALSKNQEFKKMKFCELSKTYNKFLEAKSTEKLNQAFKALVEEAKEKLSK